MYLGLSRDFLKINLFASVKLFCVFTQGTSSSNNLVEVLNLYWIVTPRLAKQEQLVS